MSLNPASWIALVLAAVGLAAAVPPASAQDHAGVASVVQDVDLRAPSLAAGTSWARLMATTPVVRVPSFDQLPARSHLHPGGFGQRRVRRPPRSRGSMNRVALHALIGAGLGAAVGSFAGWAICSNEHRDCPVMTRHTAVGGLVGLGLGIANGTR